MAEFSGEVAGLLAIRPGTLEELWVLPALHRPGVGTTLFQFVAHWLKATPGDES